MNKSKIWLLLFVIFGGCVAAVWGVIAYRGRYLAPAELIKRLPVQDSLLLYIDFSALRRAGLLQLLDGSQIGQEAEYVNFVQETEFNYLLDLDSALASFGPTGKFILAKGRFDWKALNAYALKQHGDCYNALCQMSGSTPERKISFLPLQSGLMALAVSPDPKGALRMELDEPEGPLPAPDAPVWMFLPQSILKSQAGLPDGTQLFAKTLEDAKSVTLGFSPEGNRLAARLSVLCKSDQDAALAAASLTKITQVLREMIAHAQQKPQPGDLAMVLASGSFESQGPRVSGYWPLDRSFVERSLSAR